MNDEVDVENGEVIVSIHVAAVPFIKVCHTSAASGKNIYHKGTREMNPLTRQPFADI
jgi:hypothetical protein